MGRHTFINNGGMRHKINSVHYDEQEQLRYKMRCVMNTLKQSKNANACDENYVAVLTNDVYIKCFRQGNYEYGKSSYYASSLSIDIGNTNDSEYLYWSIMDSVVFCFTIITTIGYGNVAPKTMEGRLFVIAYSIFGLPFTMLTIASLGKFITGNLTNITKLVTKIK
ncbi:unnamed protein product [Thelazia callipaeda]|uniref:Ion_trans_2 domain-containing protein n=1 Tax=Thelazia callipaeda TaxID=103827 RepID=A0A0N5CPV7_THECL|nr:unnamed protein product [Thelazia callipaeda]